MASHIKKLKSRLIKIKASAAILLAMLPGTSADSLAAGLDPGSSGRWVLWSELPPDRWEDAFVTGNGRHGTMVLANPGDNRVTCVHEELFIRGWDRHKVTVPVTTHLIPEALRLMETGMSDAAAKLITDEADRQLKEMGAMQRWPLIPHPAFDLCIDRLDENVPEVGNYRRRLDLESGETTVMWTDGNVDFEESVFSSRTDNVNVVRLKAVEGRLSVKLSLKETPGRQGSHFEHDLDNAFAKVETGASDGWLTYHAEYANDPGGYDGVARVTAKGGRILQNGNSLEIHNADEVLIVIRIEPMDCGRESRISDIKKELAELHTGYGELLAVHSREHAEMFSRMQLDFGCVDQWKTIPVEKMLETAAADGMTSLFLEQIHAMGRYLLISSCGKYAPALQGIWGGGWKPAWIGGFVWDSNINLAVSAASMSNLPECAAGYCNYVQSLLPGWRLNAKNYLGYRGFVVAHYNDPENGYLTHFGKSFPWMFWAGGAGWNLRPFYEHAMMTGDKQFLRDTVLPLYREVGEFYEDCLIQGDDGMYHICLSISPENTPPGTDTWLSKDATMDIAIVREVFGLLCNMGMQFDVDAAEIEKWSSYLDKLPGYRINGDGALAEWVDDKYPDVYHHRHNSHLYPIFPGTELARTSDTVLLEASGTALGKRFKFDTSSAHGLVHLALQACRLKNTDIVQFNIDRLSKRGYFYNGLVSSHEPGRQIYNLDAVLSFPRLLMEALVYTDTEGIELLPAWPEGYPDGSLRGVRVYGGHTLDISWKEGELTQLVIHAADTGPYTVRYRDKEYLVELQEGNSYDVNAFTI